MFERIPRGTIAASLTAVDMLSRLSCLEKQDTDLHNAVSVISRYMVIPEHHVEQSELRQCFLLVTKLYKQ